MMAKLVAPVGLQPHPHLEDGTVYRQVRPTTPSPLLLLSTKDTKFHQVFSLIHQSPRIPTNAHLPQQIIRALRVLRG